MTLAPLGTESFASHAAKITPALPQLQSETSIPGVYIHRLLFAVRYSNFHQLRIQQDHRTAVLELIEMLGDDVAPKSWWAVLLCDAVELINDGELFAFIAFKFTLLTFSRSISCHSWLECIRTTQEARRGIHCRRARCRG